MSVPARIGLLTVSCLAVGLLVILFSGLIDEATPDSKHLLWSALFALPPVALSFAYWFRELTRDNYPGLMVLKFAVALLGVPVFAVLLAASYHVGESARSRILHERGFDAHLKRFAALPRFPDPFKGRAGGTPVITGKVLVMQEPRYDVSSVQFQLPPRLQAAAPDEVQTVVLLGHARQPGGTFLDLVQLVDVASGQVTANGIVDGEDAIVQWLVNASTRATPPSP